MSARAKHTLFVSLIVINLVLLCALVVQSLHLPKANAQPVVNDVGNRFLVVSGEIQDNYDAIYIIDVVARRLYSLTMSRGVGPNAAVLRHVRNLEADFQKQPTRTVPRRGRYDRGTTR